jgi:hypothetical protein
MYSYLPLNLQLCSIGTPRRGSRKFPKNVCPREKRVGFRTGASFSPATSSRPGAGRGERAALPRVGSNAAWQLRESWSM